jgi:hypothetical protein
LGGGDRDGSIASVDRFHRDAVATPNYRSRYNASSYIAPPTPSLTDTTPNDVANNGTPVEADGGEPRQLGFHELAIAEDYSVNLVIVTASALRLGSNEPGGRALRGVLAGRGIRRLVIDEVHALSPTSMAIYRLQSACGPGRVSNRASTG